MWLCTSGHSKSMIDVSPTHHNHLGLLIFSVLHWWWEWNIVVLHEQSESTISVLHCRWNSKESSNIIPKKEWQHWFVDTLWSLASSTRRIFCKYCCGNPFSKKHTIYKCDQYVHHSFSLDCILEVASFAIELRVSSVFIPKLAALVCCYFQGSGSGYLHISFNL